MNQTVSSSRLNYWDIAKGITILLVILGHAEYVNSYVRAAIFSYHMPFFFIANGYFIKNHTILESIKKSSKSLLIPYAITCILSAVLCVYQNYGDLPNAYIFSHRIADMFMGMSKISTKFTQFESVWLVWFVICLFAARIIFISLWKLLNDRNIFLSLMIMVIFSYSGMMIGKYYAFLPWSIDIALAALPFMWFGNLLNQYEKKIHKISKLTYLICIIIWITLGRLGFVIEMATRSYPGNILCIIEAISGSLLCIGISLLIESKLPMLSSFFSFCGKNSMIILIVHCLEIRFFDWNKVFMHIPIELNWIGIFMIKLILILLVTITIVQIKNIINYLNSN